MKVIHVGLGQIGANIVRLTAARSSLHSVAGVDPSPELAGKTLVDVCGEGSPALPVHGSLAEALDDVGAAGDDGGPEVAFHAVASQVTAIESQLVELARAGLNVVTTAEELIYPHEHAAEAAQRIDEVARANGVSVFAAGVNPGVLMDRLPAYLSSLCVRVEGIRVSRLVDLGSRRPGLRRKMGVGASAADVRDRIAEGSIGHAGLLESLRHLAACLGWPIATISEELKPVVAGERVEKAGEVVEPGHVLGLEHTGEAVAADGRRLALSLVMRLDTDEPYDAIEIAGDPPIEVRFPKGVAGDLATAATVLNAAHFVVDAAPGLITRLATPCGS